jgi:hypothetical protein
MIGREGFITTPFISKKGGNPSANLDVRRDK